MCLLKVRVSRLKCLLYEIHHFVLIDTPNRFGSQDDANAWFPAGLELQLANAWLTHELRVLPASSSSNLFPLFMSFKFKPIYQPKRTRGQEKSWC